MNAEDKKWGQVLHNVVSETIESTAFMEVVPAEEEPGYDGTTAGVSLLVHDPVQGEFHIVMEDALLKYLTETVYGPLFGEVTVQNEQDFLAELLNTVAGRFLSEILPADTSFRLGIPESLIDAGQLPGPPAICWTFAIEEMYFSFCVVGDSLLDLA